MNFNEIDQVWLEVKIFKEAFKEHILCFRKIYDLANQIIDHRLSDSEFYVKIDKIPKELFTLRKNLFSTLFQSIYHLLKINQRRRLLYGKLNCLFRIWVTSADNLLDGEEKFYLPLRLSGNSRIMQQIISIMLADRIMNQLLMEAMRKGIISSRESKTLSCKSLQMLLPSAAEEASEEKGIRSRPNPDYVLSTIHRLKTGILFHIPFLGPETIEDCLDKTLLKKCKDALSKFALGCQLLDDIRDITKDYLEKRHNYIISKMYWNGKYSQIQFLKKFTQRMDVSEKVYLHFQEVVNPVSKLAKTLLRESLLILNECGLGLKESAIEEIGVSIFKVLGIEELSNV
jgi:hypothetical protein